MRPKQNGRVRRLALTTISTIIVSTSSLALNVATSAAVDAEKYYEDSQANICLGLEFPGGFPASSCEWGSHVTSGVNNVALGESMMPLLTSGSYNVALGNGALASNTTGVDNIAAGRGALAANTSGSHNIASGEGALEDNTSGNNNIATGVRALQHNTTGNQNTAIGEATLEFNTNGNNNFAGGGGSLEHNTSGDQNVAIGVGALALNTTGSADVASGLGALANNSGGSQNIAFGMDALFRNTTGAANVACGDFALAENTTGAENVACGEGALGHNTTGNHNVASGAGAGTTITSGSHDIDIANAGGEATETGTTRIGTEGVQTHAYIAGIYQKATKEPACDVKVDAEGQLGCGASGVGAVATFASRAKNVPSGNCLKYTDLTGPGTGPCPASTTGWSNSALLAGPTPAGGATVSGLFADSNATVSGSDTVLIAVIDNTTGATLLSCTLNSATPNRCSNSTGSGFAAAGDNLEVKVVATGPSGNNKLWRVTFRY